MTEKNRAKAKRRALRGWKQKPRDGYERWKRKGELAMAWRHAKLRFRDTETWERRGRKQGFGLPPCECEHCAGWRANGRIARWVAARAKAAG